MNVVQMSERRCVLFRQPRKAIISKSFKCPKPLPCPAAGHTSPRKRPMSFEHEGFQGKLHVTDIYLCVYLYYSVARNLSSIQIHMTVMKILRPKISPQENHHKSKKKIIKANSQYQLSSDKRINYRKRTHIRASGAKATLLPITYLHIFCYSSSFQAPRPYRVA